MEYIYIIFHQHRHPPGRPDCRPSRNHTAPHGHCWRCRCTSNLGAPSWSRSPCRCSPAQGVSPRPPNPHTGSELHLGFDAPRRCVQVCSSGLMSRRLKFRNSAHHQGPINRRGNKHQGTPSLPSVPVSRTQRSDSVRHRLGQLRYQLPHDGTDQPKGRTDFLRCRFC